MKDEEKLLLLDLEIEKKKQLNHPEGVKLYLFRTLYSILQNDSLNQFCKILFIIFQFIQLMAFSMDTIFSEGWKTYLYETIGNFFRFFQFIFLWKGNTQFFIITYIITGLYIIILLIGFIHALIKSSSLSYKSKNIFKLISYLIEFDILLNIPFLRTLFSVFICKNGILEASLDIKCLSNAHICLIIISVILILAFITLIILFKITLYQFGEYKRKINALYTSSTEILLQITKFLLVILYQFISNGKILSIINFLLSFILLIHFLNKQPFSNGFAMKLYFLLYSLFFWSSTICFIALLLKNSKFEAGVLLLILGYPIIIISIALIEWDFSIDKIFSFLEIKEKDPYKALLEIEYFVKMEESLEDKVSSKEHTILYSYISNYEKTCTDINCPLKKFLNLPLKVENFTEMKIYLLQHAEMLYKNAVSKFPFYAKLRLSYGLFIYKKLHKKLRGKNEIIILNKYDTNLEDSFLIYKAQRVIQDDNEEELENKNNSKIEEKANNVNSITYKIILNKIKSLIGKIALNYIDFWRMLALNEDNEHENFIKMSKVGINISNLNEELLEEIKILENVNLYDQEVFKLYIQYLSEILNNNIKANMYINKLSENDKKHMYNEENLFELNYKLMSKSEDYKYIVLNCSPSNFNTICNLSLSVCQIFGYSREELIGRSYDILLPELFGIHQRNLLKNKVIEFKNKLLIKNEKMRSNSWNDNSFSRNKMKYLIPVKTRWTLISSDDEKIYAIGKIIIDNKTPTELEQEIIYVLTDKNLIIQNFTSNAPKLLYLYSSAINNNLDITEFIKEFNEDYISNIEDLEEIKESNISNFTNNTTKRKMRYIKTEIIKRMFLEENDSKKVIHWRLGDIITKDIYQKNNKNGILNKKSSFASINLNEQKFQSAHIDSTRKNIKNAKINANNLRKKRSFGINSNLDNNEAMKVKHLLSSNTEEKLPNLNQEKIIDIKDEIISDFNQESSLIVNDKNNKDRFYYHRPVHHKFTLSVNEVKFDEIKIGYIFKLEPYSSKKLDETNINKNNP